MIDCLSFHTTKRGRKQNRDEGFCRKMQKNVSQMKDCAGCRERESSMKKLAQTMRRINFNKDWMPGFVHRLGI